jgi:hypothetical protein
MRVSRVSLENNPPSCEKKIPTPPPEKNIYSRGPLSQKDTRDTRKLININEFANETDIFRCGYPRNRYP